MVITYSKSLYQPDKVVNPARCQLNRKNKYFPCPHSRLRIWSRETGSAVPSRVSLLILHTQAESAAFRGGLPFLYRQPPSGQSRVYEVTQLRTDGVHCQESRGTRPVVLKVVPVAGATFSGITTGQLMCASLFPRLLLILDKAKPLLLPTSYINLTYSR